MLVIDGSVGEGGGQILRSALALSLLTGTAFRIMNIRAGRSRPGLMRQHLMAVNAAAQVGDAETSGAEIGSKELVFSPKSLCDSHEHVPRGYPRGVRSGDYTFAIGGAGSTTLVFQTVLYPLLLGAKTSSTLKLEGGTHNPMAPPIDFLQHAFLPQLSRMGARVEIDFTRHGFYPAGGGAWSVAIQPLEKFSRLDLMERGEIRSRRASALVAQIPGSVAIRELDALAKQLDWDRDECRPLMIQNSHGPGNALVATVQSEHITEVFTAFGERGISAEKVAQNLADEVTRYLKSKVPVGEHLADQLLLPMALGEGGSFRTLKPTEHCRTQASLIQMFLGSSILMHEESADVWRVDVQRNGSLEKS
jgi:RNA 3'-terminal phosphate cyclase (ATP)